MKTFYSLSECVKAIYLDRSQWFVEDLNKDGYDVMFTTRGLAHPREACVITQLSSDDTVDADIGDWFVVNSYNQIYTLSNDEMNEKYGLLNTSVNTQPKKICKNCHYCKGIWCSNEMGNLTDIVDGTSKCHEERTLCGNCGPEGKLYSAKKETFASVKDDGNLKTKMSWWRRLCG